MKLYHGGAPGLTPGDHIIPAPNQRAHDGCPICEARATGRTVTVDGQAIDGPTGHGDSVYVTTDRLYAKFYASMAHGDLYTVTADHLEPSDEDPLIPSYRCPSATVSTVVERHIQLTDAERRRLWRRMGGTTAEWRTFAAQMPAVMADVRSALQDPAT